jgi:hypothetical protein
MSDILSDLKKCVAGATKKWTKQRKAEERSARARYGREYVYSDRVNYTDVARNVLARAYDHASGGGRYSVSIRQFYYAARDDFEKLTGRPITHKTFASLLVTFTNRHPSIAGAWRVTADPRGTLIIPNTHHDVRVPCGTIQINEHLHDVAHEHCGIVTPELPEHWPSIAAGQRYRAVLYIEKEGFEPLMNEARIAERYEIAVLSCKGQSVVAARKFVDEVCKVNGGVPLFIVHDFDVPGFFIAARLTSVSEDAACDYRVAERIAYHFKNDIDFTDFGLRLEDVEKYGLASERCKRPPRIPDEFGCTHAEVEYLQGGRRVELNAFTAPDFIQWLEGKLQAAGIAERMLPDDNVLEAAYRRAAIVAKVNAAVRDAHAAAVAEDAGLVVPDDLRERLREAIDQNDEQWDLSLHRLVVDELGLSDDK